MTSKMLGSSEMQAWASFMHQYQVFTVYIEKKIIVCLINHFMDIGLVHIEHFSNEEYITCKKY